MIVLDETDINPSTGLTADEDAVSGLTGLLWNAWLKLPEQHPDDSSEVCRAVHEIQRLLTIRIARRLYPAAWPTLIAPQTVATPYNDSWEREYRTDEEIAKGQKVYVDSRGRATNKPPYVGMLIGVAVADAKDGKVAVKLQLELAGRTTGVP